MVRAGSTALFADAGYAGEQLTHSHAARQVDDRHRQATDVAEGLMLPRRWNGERLLACIDRNRRLAEAFENSITTEGVDYDRQCQTHPTAISERIKQPRDRNSGSKPFYGMLHPQVGKHGTAEIIYDIGLGTMVTDSVEIAVMSGCRAVRADPAVVSQKRVFDVIVASLLLVAFAPFMAVAAAFVRFVSRGPALYRQERVGWHGRPFCILKLRTMHVSAAADASTVTRSNDVRLIRGGRWLRKFKIDELPQILNVLGGSMSLVGPRPTVREDVERMTPAQRQRLLVRPGLTGLAQIRGNTALPWPRRVELDLDYISTLSLSQDLRIIAESASQILTGRADTHPAGEDEWS